MWHYKSKSFQSDDIPADAVGFVYLLTHKETGLKYIGKKNFYSKRKLPPLKGKKRKRTVIKESDWYEYTGSNGWTSEQAPEDFHREILHICNSAGVLSYMEVVEQIDRRVLIDDTYLNGIIQCRINASHLKSKSFDDA